MAAMVLGASAQATVLFDSRGFEAPGYTLGNLEGQNGWNKSLSSGSNAVVQSSVASDGTQAIRINSNGGMNWYSPEINYTPGAAEILSVRADIARTVGPSAGLTSFGYFVDAYSPTGVRIARVGLGLDGTSIRPVLSSRFTGGLPDAAGTPGNMAFGPVVSPLQFVSFELQMNFQTKTFDVWMDYVLVQANLPFVDQSATTLTSADLQISTNGNITDAGYFDNYAVAVVPAPGPASLIAAGTLLLLRRRGR